MTVSASLKSALAVLPETSRVLRFRGHDAVLYPMDAAAWVSISLQDGDMVTAFWGIDLQTGQPAPPEQVEAARGKISIASAARIIAKSMRDPEIEALVPNMTRAEIKRGVDAALELSVAGDPEGFFGDQAAIMLGVLKLASMLPKEASSTSVPAAFSTPATPSPSSSKPRRSSKPKSGAKSGRGRPAKSSSKPT